MGKELEGQPGNSGSGRTLSRGDSVNRGREVSTLVQLEHRTCVGTRGPGPGGPDRALRAGQRAVERNQKKVSHVSGYMMVVFLTSWSCASGRLSRDAAGLSRVTSRRTVT